MTEYRTSAFNAVMFDARWKGRVKKENYSQRYQWPHTWGFIVDEYYQLDLDLHNGQLTKPRPPPIKPFDPDSPPTEHLPPLSDTTHSDQQHKATRFPRTTSGLIGWSTTHAPVLKNTAELERRARPLGDIRKTFGWPARVD